MSDLADLTKEQRAQLMEQARVRLARRQPGFGLRSFNIGMGIPVVTVVALMIFAHHFFTATLAHRVMFLVLAVIAAVVGVAVAWHDRSATIEHEALRVLHDE